MGEAGLATCEGEGEAAFVEGVLSLDEGDAVIFGDDEGVPSFGKALSRSGLWLAFLPCVLVVPIPASVSPSPIPSLWLSELERENSLTSLARLVLLLPSSIHLTGDPTIDVVSTTGFAHAGSNSTFERFPNLHVPSPPRPPQMISSRLCVFFRNRRHSRVAGTRVV